MVTQAKRTFQPKWVNPNMVIVRVDRAAQREKRTQMKNGLYIPPGSLHQRFNLQQGIIVGVGRNIEKIMGILPGEKLLFHHSVEGSVMSPEERKRLSWIIDHTVFNEEYVEPDSIYYKVPEDLIYGCIKQDNTIVCHPDIMLAIASPEEENNRDLTKIGHLYLFKNFKEEREDVEKRIAKMKEECESHPTRAAILMPEMERLTKELNKKRAGTFMPVFVSDAINSMFPEPLDTTMIVYYEFLGSKGTVPQVTMVEVDGYTFYVLRKRFVVGARTAKSFRDESDTITLYDVTTEHHQKEAEAAIAKSDPNQRIAPGIIIEEGGYTFEFHGADALDDPKDQGVEKDLSLYLLPPNFRNEQPEDEQ